MFDILLLLIFPNDQIFLSFFCQERNDALFDLIGLDLLVAASDRDRDTRLKPAEITLVGANCGPRQLSCLPLNINFKFMLDRTI